jgi:rhodanese-related sulfurtransferase
VVEAMLDRARRRIERVLPEQLEQVLDDGGLLVDIRPEAQRRAEGTMPGALVIERNVLEWRFDLTGDYSIREATDYQRRVIVVCSEGYASSFAAASLVDLGYQSAGDLEGGYQAWRRWKAGRSADPTGS